MELEHQGRGVAFAEHRAAVVLQHGSVAEAGEVLAQALKTGGQFVLGRNIRQGVAELPNAIVQRGAVGGLGGGVGAESDAGRAARIGRALAGQIADVRVAGAEVHPGRLNAGHLAEEPRQRAGFALPLGKVDLRGRHIDAGGDGFLLGEISGFVGAGAVLQGGALLGQVLGGLLVCLVGGQPELPPDLLVIVFHRQGRATGHHLHAASADVDEEEVGVVELVIAHAHLDDEPAAAAGTAAVQGAETGRHAGRFGIDDAIGDEVRLFEVLDGELLHGARHFVAHGLHDHVVLGV